MTMKEERNVKQDLGVHSIFQENGPVLYITVMMLLSLQISEMHNTGIIHIINVLIFRLLIYTQKALI